MESVSLTNQGADVSIGPARRFRWLISGIDTFFKEACGWPGLT